MCRIFENNVWPRYFKFDKCLTCVERVEKRGLEQEEAVPRCRRV